MNMTRKNPRIARAPKGSLRAGPRPDAFEAAFTMVEIAICIAVAAFAMVAIIGVLPTGFQVQKDNREDTIVNQEGMLWLEAIRSGARGMEYLTNHVDFVLLEERPASSAVSETNLYRLGNGYGTGFEIVGLLTQPKHRVDLNNEWRVRRAQAVVRALGGTAIDKTPTNDFAFNYLLTVEAVPFNPFPPTLTNFTDNSLSPEQRRFRQVNHDVAKNMADNVHELRLTIEWPADLFGDAANPGIRVGRGRKEFRALANGAFETMQANGGVELNWKQPADFRIAQ